MKTTAIAGLALMPLLVLGQGIRSFADEDYQNVLRSQSRVLFYTFSPSMPLSLNGLKEIHAASEALGATLVPLADPAASAVEILKVADARVRYQRSQFLRDRGIQLHYPSVIVANGHKLVGAPIAGFKTRDEYVTLISEMISVPWKDGLQLTREIALPRPMSAFFKPVYGTDLIVSAWPQGPGGNYLFDLKSGAVFDISDYGDPGPTPDGEFVTLLSAGLAWFSIPEVLGGKPRNLLDDPGLRTYQSVGQLSASRYRVIGALSSSTNPAGLIVRDYEAKTGPQGKSVASADGNLFKDWRRLCDGKRISIPMISKTGQLLSGSYDGTLRVFRIGPNATECDLVFDTKAVTGKADFNREATALSYVARATNPSTAENVDAIFVADLGLKQPFLSTTGGQRHSWLSRPL